MKDRRRKPQRRVISPFAFDFPLCCPESVQCSSVLGWADDLFEELDFVTIDFSGESSCEISVFSPMPEYPVKLQYMLSLKIYGQKKLAEETAPCMPTAEMYNSPSQFPVCWSTGTAWCCLKMHKLSRGKENWTRQFYAAQSLFTTDRSEKGLSDQPFQANYCSGWVGEQMLLLYRHFHTSTTSWRSPPHIPLCYTHSQTPQTSKWTESTCFPSLCMEQNAHVDKPRLRVCEENTLNGASVRPTLDINQGCLKLQVALSNYVEKNHHSFWTGLL